MITNSYQQQKTVTFSIGSTEMIINLKTTPKIFMSFTVASQTMALSWLRKKLYVLSEVHTNHPNTAFARS
jgi:hypothetical protein